MSKKEWLYAVLALVGGVFGGAAGNYLWSGAAAIAAQEPARIIAAQQLQLVDRAGKAHASLYLNGSGQPSFDLYDTNGKTRTGLGIDPDGNWGFKLLDTKGTLRITATINAEDIATFRLFDSQARMRALFGVDNSGEPALDFYTGDGRLLRELP